jgi:hypothetical protein
MKILGISITIGILLLVVSGLVLYVSTFNTFKRTKIAYEAQVSVDKAVHDEMKKVVFGQAKVSEKYSADFEKIYVKVMDARYKDGAGKMMQWITEQNPNFDPSLYKQLMNTIESQRSKFTANQKKMISLHAELESQIATFPGNFLLFNQDLPELKLVTSSDTEKAFETGEDNDKNIF